MNVGLSILKKTNDRFRMREIFKENMLTYAEDAIIKVRKR